MSLSSMMKGASRMFAKEATLTKATTTGINPFTGAHTQGNETVPAAAHWTAFTDAMKRSGIIQRDRHAHMVDDGQEPSVDDVLTIEGETMTIRQAVWSSERAIWFLGGD